MPIEKHTKVVETNTYKVTMDLSDKEFALLYLMVNQSCAKVSSSLRLNDSTSREAQLGLWRKLMEDTELMEDVESLRKILSAK